MSELQDSFGRFIFSFREGGREGRFSFGSASISTRETGQIFPAKAGRLGGFFVWLIECRF